MEHVNVSNKIFKKLEKLRPKGKPMNRVIHALLLHNKLTKKEIDEVGL